MSGSIAHVWLIRLDDDSATERAQALLPAVEVDRLAQVLPQHRGKRACAQAALRALVAAEISTTPLLLRIAREPNGKPFLVDDAGLHISFAHSGAVAVVAFTRAAPIGADVEQPRWTPDAAGLAETMMSGTEYARWRLLPGPLAAETLFRSWTYKEAVLKAIGTGLSGDVRAVVTHPGLRGEPILDAVPSGAGETRRWTLRDLSREYGMPVAVAIAAPAVEIRTHVVRIGELVPARAPVAEPRQTSQRRPRLRSHRLLVEIGGRANALHKLRPTRKEPTMTSKSAAIFETEERAPSTPAADIVQAFCIPHAGGSASSYRSWAEWLPPGVELITLELPGHSTRMREPLITEWQRLVDDLVATVKSQLVGGYVLAGHSLGALLAYEVGRTMMAHDRPPRLLMVSGHNGPTAGLSHRPIHPLPDDQFLEALSRLGGTPAAIMEQPELRRLYLPLLRADLRLSETYGREPGPPLPFPVAAFAGRQDRLTDDEGLIAWNRETTEVFDLNVVDSGHFFHDEPAFKAAANARLARLGLPA